MAILSKPFWAAVTAAVPFDDGEADWTGGGGGGGKKSPTVLRAAQEWNSRVIVQCCCYMVTASKFDVVGKTLLRRGLVQLLYQQDALHPDVLWAGLVCRFSCIDFLLHSNWILVGMAFSICLLTSITGR